MEQQKVLKPLEKIALSCSGGGHRAAAFHMGTMSYLNRIIYFGKPLLHNVEMLSTVSGGTITGIFYAIGLQDGKDFQTIYTELRNKLSTLDLLKTGFSMLNVDHKWANEHKSKNLINAFALQYDKEFTKGYTLGDLQTIETHLKRAVFNSTEFKNGINFRFRSTNAPKEYSGNKFIKISRDFRPYIKLSDVMASSSCFPGGFEPMLWPSDFKYSTIADNEIFKGDPENTGLMDGGIYDNQGIDSILLYKKTKKPYFDLIIISDVASPYIDSFKVFKEGKKASGWELMTLKKLYEKFTKINKRITYGLLGALVLCSIYPILYKFPNTIWTGVFSTVFLLLCGLLFLKVRGVDLLKKRFQTYVEEFKSGDLKFYIEKIRNLRIEELSFHTIQPLLFNRINSLSILLMDVFLKVSRGLNYSKLYDDKDYENRKISSMIRELTEDDYKNKTKKPGQNRYFTDDYNNVIGDEIKKVAESAAGFGTTLWFTEEEVVGQMLDKLLATGQFTMCYNLIVYLDDLMSNQIVFDLFEDHVKNELKALRQFCINDWQRFKAQPTIMVNNLKF